MATLLGGSEMGDGLERVVYILYFRCLHTFKSWKD